MRLLLIEESARADRRLAERLRSVGYALHVAGDGTEGLWRSASYDYDLIILGSALREGGGISLLKQLRRRRDRTPVLVLARGDAAPSVPVALEEGADDFLSEPFAFDELLARVKALVRRGYGITGPLIKASPVDIDIVRREVLRSGAPVPLTKREYAVLEYLAMRRGQVTTREQIESHVLDEEAEPMSNVIDKTVCSLRHKLDPPGGPSIIETRRGFGYVVPDRP